MVTFLQVNALFIHTDARLVISRPSTCSVRSCVHSFSLSAALEERWDSGERHENGDALDDVRSGLAEDAGRVTRYGADAGTVLCSIELRASGG